MWKKLERSVQSVRLTLVRFDRPPRVSVPKAGSVDEELLPACARSSFEESIKGRSRLTDGERRTLAEVGKRLG